MVTIISYPPSLKNWVTPRVWSSQLADRSFYANTSCFQIKQRTGLKTWMSWFLETKWELLAMHVAVSSLSPVSIQIWEENNMKKHSVTETAQKWSKIKQIRSSVISNTLWLINMKIHQILIRCNIIVFLLFIPPEVIIKQLSFKVSILLFKHNANKQQNEFFFSLNWEKLSCFNLLIISSTFFFYSLALTLPCHYYFNSFVGLQQSK